ncbi:uncharacterized protein LOC144134400 [Amblyomma americanum]
MAPVVAHGLLYVVLMSSVAYLVPVRILVGMVLTDSLLTAGASMFDAAFCASLPSLETVCASNRFVQPNTGCHHLTSGQCRYSNNTLPRCSLHNATPDDASAVRAYCLTPSFERAKNRVRVRECCQLSCKFAADAILAVVWLILLALMLAEVLAPAPQLPEVMQEALQLGPPPRPPFDRRRG